MAGFKVKTSELHYFGETAKYMAGDYFGGHRGKGIKKVKRQFRERMGEKVDKWKLKEGYRAFFL